MKRTKHKHLTPIERITKLERDANDLIERVCVDSEKLIELDESVLNEVDALHNEINSLRKSIKFNKLLLTMAIILAIVL
jgi:hypothetical protein